MEQNKKPTIWSKIKAFFCGASGKSRTAIALFSLTVGLAFAIAGGGF